VKHPFYSVFQDHAPSTIGNKVFLCRLLGVMESCKSSSSSEADADSIAAFISTVNVWLKNVSILQIIYPFHQKWFDNVRERLKLTTGDWAKRLAADPDVVRSLRDFNGAVIKALPKKSDTHYRAFKRDFAQCVSSSKDFLSAVDLDKMSAFLRDGVAFLVLKEQLLHFFGLMSLLTVPFIRSKYLNLVGKTKAREREKKALTERLTQVNDLMSHHVQSSPFYKDLYEQMTGESYNKELGGIIRIIEGLKQLQCHVEKICSITRSLSKHMAKTDVMTQQLVQITQNPNWSNIEDSSIESFLDEYIAENERGQNFCLELEYSAMLPLSADMLLKRFVDQICELLNSSDSDWETNAPTLNMMKKLIWEKLLIETGTPTRAKERLRELLCSFINGRTQCGWTPDFFQQAIEGGPLCVKDKDNDDVVRLEL